MGFSIPKNGRDLSLVICGSAGQGLQSLESLLVRLALSSGFHVFSTKEYMSRVRGGSNSQEIRLSPSEVSAPVERIDLLVPLTLEAIERIKHRITDETLIVGESAFVTDEIKAKCGLFIDIPFTEKAKEIGQVIYTNQLVLGVIASLLALDADGVEKRIKEFFKDKGAEAIEKNIRAFFVGSELGAGLIGLTNKEAARGLISPVLETGGDRSRDILLSGAEAMGLGAIAGGCDFIAAYPMSPSTGVLTFLAKHAKEFDIVAEQCEDEIAGINMALGAWYAGSRALASSSGGGFALMIEGTSLSAMIESPIVIHIAQRPGPATGLPTRTEQGDLNLALYAGHGEFARIILAPATVSEAFYLTQKAFNLADRFQLPVFILTDQYLMDMRVNTPQFDLSGLERESHIVETKADYKRYAFTDTGLSPRGIPGFGTGFVAVDSDEHDEDGRITEDMEMREQMVEKRLKRFSLLEDSIEPPLVIGNEEAGTVILGWGSTLGIIREALERIDSPDVLYIHHSQPYPLHELSIRHIKRAKRRIVIEGNATAQFARLVICETGVEIEEKILKYNGLQFSVEEVEEGLSKLI
jgi:2-oxoglutarate ferredoxin oxidoreductase subunit alpha